MPAAVGDSGAGNCAESTEEKARACRAAAEAEAASALTVRPPVLASCGPDLSVWEGVAQSSEYELRGKRSIGEAA